MKFYHFDFLFDIFSTRYLCFRESMIKKKYIRLIFGLKLKQFRQEKNLLLSDLSQRSGLSISYLNEIETGKKYPKEDKIASLAEALGTSFDKLVSLKLVRNLAPIEELLESNILDQLPLDHYGININKLISLMSNSSMQLSALIATFIETAQSSELSQNIFSRNALRNFKEFNENYFDDIEAAAKEFRKKIKIKPVRRIKFQQLKSILEEEYNYEINESSLNEYAGLSELRAVVLNGKQNRLLLNANLSEAQKAFIAGKELAYNFLGIKDRSLIYPGIKLNTFDHLLNYFRVSYFSTALLINSDFLIQDLEKLFRLPAWDEDRLLTIISSFNSTTEMFFQRVANLAPKYFGLNKFFFFRLNHDMSTGTFSLSNELRLNTQRNFNELQPGEHYCRRWISFEILNRMTAVIKKNKNFNERIAGVLHSKFFGSGDEYLSISVAQRGTLFKNYLSSLTIGFQIDDTLLKKIKFLSDFKIQNKIVNDTCERCTITDCRERAAPPSYATKIEHERKLEEALSELKEKMTK